jgi:hypothetical protein
MHHSVSPSRPVPTARSVLPTIGTVTVVVTGMAFGLGGGFFVDQQRGAWLTPGDFWVTVASAWDLLSGHGSSLYSGGLVGIPGIVFLMAPAVALTHAIGLQSVFPGEFMSRPDAWLVLGPIEMASGYIALRGLDTVASLLGSTFKARIVLCGAETVLIWPVLVIWGHPEDVIAVGCVLYSAIYTSANRWARGAVYLGAAIAVQPLAILAAPAVLMRVVREHRFRTAVIASLLPAALLTCIAVIAPGGVFRGVLIQPQFTLIDQVTPWVRIAPQVGLLTVSALPNRALAVVFAVALSVLATRGKEPLRPLVAVVALAFALRAFFEPVLVPFYLWPALAVALVVIASDSWRRLAVASSIACAICVASQFPHFGEFLWLLEMLGTFSVVAIMGISLRTNANHSPAMIGPGTPLSHQDRLRSQEAMVGG